MGIVMGDGRRKSAAALERAERAWAMRAGGESWDTITRQLGFANKQNTMRAVRNFAGTMPTPERGALRTLWQERTELLWKEALQDVYDRRPGAVRAAVAVAQRASALFGLDAPQQVQVSTPEADEFNRLVSAVFHHRNPELPQEADIFALEEGEDGVFAQPEGEGTSTA
jgi:hypothetical protein